MTVRIAGRRAWKILAKSERAKWSSNLTRFGEALALVDHTPKFSLSADESIFCIGSCFARNIEEHLVYNGRNVLSKRIVCPASEWPGRVNGIVNKFTTASMLNELDWVHDPPAVDLQMFDETPGGWLDLQLCAGVRPASGERVIERRQYLINDYFARLRQSSTVILTLGLTEAWHDKKIGRYLNAAPPKHSTWREPDRYVLEVTDVASNVHWLERIYQRLQGLRNDIKVIVTVSPVPMNSTFTGRDVLVANMASKSTLRVAAEAFANNHANVDYYPSYDMVAMAPRVRAYGPDCLHVADQTVGQVIRLFLDLYAGHKNPPSEFNEIAYLAANPDVEAEVRLGVLESGFEHWLKTGREEGRKLAPEGGATRLMIKVGSV